MPADKLPIDGAVPVKHVWPEKGRLCFRALKEGEAMVGVLHLPKDFEVTEGQSYLLARHPGHFSVLTEPVDGGIPDRYVTGSVGDLMTSPIWRKTEHRDFITVRFIKAFPDTNGWAVYGVTHHSPGDHAPSHSWVDIKANGEAHPIAAPFDAAGEAIGQLLASNPVWPDRQGVLHTLSQIQSPWREHHHRYHQLLVAAARDPAVSETLEKTIKADPILRELSIGSIDRTYCSFLDKLDQAGMLKMDAPQTEAEYKLRNEASNQAMKAILADDDDDEESYQAPAPPSRRSPRA